MELPKKRRFFHQNIDCIISWSSNESKCRHKNCFRYQISFIWVSKWKKKLWLIDGDQMSNTHGRDAMFCFVFWISLQDLIEQESIFIDSHLLPSSSCSTFLLNLSSEWMASGWSFLICLGVIFKKWWRNEWKRFQELEMRYDIIYFLFLVQFLSISDVFI
jgi:hypothetical protein